MKLELKRYECSRCKKVIFLRQACGRGSKEELHSLNWYGGCKDCRLSIIVYSNGEIREIDD